MPQHYLDRIPGTFKIMSERSRDYFSLPFAYGPVKVFSEDLFVYLKHLTLYADKLNERRLNLFFHAEVTPTDRTLDFCPFFGLHPLAFS